MKYINADELMAKIYRLIKTETSEPGNLLDEGFSTCIGEINDIITSLQQEQPECLGSLVDVDSVREDFIAEVYRVLDADTTNDRANAIIDAFDSLPTVYQEQPEVDLEKFTEKIKTFQARYKYPESISIKGAMAFMARMFYQYPNVAKRWYEQLPKATMD